MMGVIFIFIDVHISFYFPRYESVDWSIWQEKVDLPCQSLIIITV